MSIEFSEYQKAIFADAESGRGNTIINAVAGSGKTFTLLKLMEKLVGNVVFLAFNKSIADELKAKAPAHVDVCTLHSLGFKAVRYAYKSRLETQKLNMIMDTIPQLETYRGMRLEERKQVLANRKMIKSLVSISKATLCDYNRQSELMKVSYQYAIDYTPEIYPLFVKVMDRSIEQTNIIDFDDMIYFPVVNKLSLYKYDYVMIDESQDLNRCQIELVLNAVKPSNGRIFAVGDPKQSIYGFKGADSEAMSRLQDALKAKELPLSVCYRCPKSHIEMAQNLVPYIEAKPDAPEGEIAFILDKDFVKEVSQEDSPLVLCRTNAPLVSNALSLIAEGYKAFVKGKDIGQNLIAVVNKLKATDLEDLFEKLTKWESKQIKSMTSRKAPESTIELVKDKADVIKVVAESCDTPQCVIDKLERIFKDDNSGDINLSTVHRAKGLEADTVYILHPEKLPLRYKNQQAWELEQEYNIKYVALTRSKNKLVFVNNQ